MELLSLLLQATTFSVPAAALCVAITVISAAFGISRIGKSAVESTARQPEAGSDIRSTMIISAALIEGVSLFAIVVCGFILVK